MIESQRDKDVCLPPTSAQLREKSTDGVSWTAMFLAISLMVNVSLLIANYHTYQALLRCFGE
jgi:hypothetical protein